MLKARQRGVTLIELMVGIAIGLLVVAVAMGALMVSRGVSGTVSDASGIQQQSTFVMRAIGMQLRQAGSLYLNPNPTSAPADALVMAPVAFETKAVSTDGTGANFDPVENTLSAPGGGLSAGFRRYKEAVHTSPVDQTIGRNCLGGPTDSLINTDQVVESIFQLNGTELRCTGNKNTQAIAQNVSNFQVRYLIQDNTQPSIPTLKYVNAAAVSDWLKVQAVEVCVVIFGTEAISMPTDGSSTYRDCDNTAVDMTTLSGARNRRMHITYRNVFQLRGQGLTRDQLL